MRKFLWLFLALPLAAFAQPSNPSVQYVAVAPSGACSASPPVQVVSSTGAMYTCNNGTWSAVSGGGSGYPLLTSPGQPTYTFWVTGPLLLQQAAGSGYTGTGTCTLTGGTLVSGSLDTCTATQSGGAITFAIVGSGIYSVWPKVVLGGVSAGSGAYAQAYNDPANTTIYARQESTGTITSGTDAAVFVNGIYGGLAATGGHLYFKNGVYPVKTFNQETTSGWTTYYYAIGIPAGTPAGVSANSGGVQFITEGETRPEWAWGISSFPTIVQNNGVVFVSSSTADASVASSNMIMIFFQRPAGTNVSNEDKFKNLAGRFSSISRGNQTAFAMWMTSAPEYENVEASVNVPVSTIAAGSAPVAGTLGSFGLTSSYGSSGLPAMFKSDVVWGYNIGFDFNEHTISIGDDSIMNNYPMEIGRGGPNAPGSGPVYHPNTIIKFVDQEDANGPILGPELQIGCRIDMSTYDIEQGASAHWWSGRSNGGATETNANTCVGNITYAYVATVVGNVTPLPPFFTSGGGSFCINNTSTACKFPISYDFAKVENPLSNNGNFTASDSSGMAKVISAGVAEPISTATNAYGIYTGAIWPTAQYSELKALTDSDAANYLVLYTNVTSLSSENAYQLNITGGGGVNIIAYVAGVAHTLGAGTTITVHAGDVFSLNRGGTNPATLTVTQTTGGATTQVYQQTDSTYAGSITGGYPGFALYAPTTIASLQISNWRGGTLQ